MTGTILEDMNRFSETWAVAYVWPLVWQSSLLVGLVWLASRSLFRKSSPQLRYCLWLVVVARLLLPPGVHLPTSVGHWGPGLAQSSRQWFASAPETAAAVPALTETALQGAVYDAGQFVFEPPTERTPEMASNFVASASVQSEGFSSSPSAVTATATFSPPAVTPTVFTALFILWMAGVALIFAQGVRKWRRLQAARRESLPADEALRALTREHAGRLGVRRPVATRVAKGISGPAVLGIWRPTILVPEEVARELDDEALTAVIIHELAHVRRLDLLVNWFQLATGVLFFFHPLVWLANRQIRVEREKACDDLALTAASLDPQSYAKSLLSVMSLAGGGRAAWAPGALGMAERRTTMGQRVLRILDPSVRPAPRLRPAGILVVLAFAACFLTFTRAPADPVKATEGKEKNGFFVTMEVVRNVKNSFPARARVNDYLLGKKTSELDQDALEMLKVAGYLRTEKSLIFQVGEGGEFTYFPKIKARGSKEEQFPSLTRFSVNKWTVSSETNGQGVRLESALLNVGADNLSLTSERGADGLLFRVALGEKEWTVGPGQVLVEPLGVLSSAGVAERNSYLILKTAPAMPKFPEVEERALFGWHSVKATLGLRKEKRQSSEPATCVMGEYEARLVRIDEGKGECELLVGKTNGARPPQRVILKEHDEAEIEDAILRLEELRSAVSVYIKITRKESTEPIKKPEARFLKRGEPTGEIGGWMVKLTRMSKPQEGELGSCELSLDRYSEEGGARKIQTTRAKLREGESVEERDMVIRALEVNDDREKENFGAIIEISSLAFENSPMGKWAPVLLRFDFTEAEDVKSRYERRSRGERQIDLVANANAVVVRGPETSIAKLKNATSEYLIPIEKVQIETRMVQIAKDLRAKTRQNLIERLERPAEIDEEELKRWEKSNLITLTNGPRVSVMDGEKSDFQIQQMAEGRKVGKANLNTESARGKMAKTIGWVDLISTTFLPRILDDGDKVGLETHILMWDNKNTPRVLAEDMELESGEWAYAGKLEDCEIGEGGQMYLVGEVLGAEPTAESPFEPGVYMLIKGTTVKE